MLFFSIVLTAFMLLVIYFDATRFIIPNWINGVFLALWPMVFLLSPEAIDWKMHLITFVCAFAVGFIIFSLKWMGGGDVKMLAVAALWTGHEQLMTFLIVMGVLGGALAILLLFGRKIIGFWYKPEQLPRIFHIGAPAPYGIAIAGAFLLLLWDNQIPGL